MKNTKKDDLDLIWSERSLSESVQDKLFRRSLKRYDFLLNAYTNMRETFVYEQYAWLASGIRKGTIAIDIGTSIGDTAVYLAKQRNVSAVIAFEPDSGRFKEAKLNLRLSGLRNVQLYNRAVDMQILNSALAKKGSYVIKCDCEGAEHRIFTDKTHLADVYRVQLEYHNGVGYLKRVFERAGFTVEVEEPWSKKNVGWLRAWRR